MGNLLSGYDVLPTRLESKIATGLRLAQYPDGEQRLQGAYQWTEGFSTGLVWKTMPVTMVDSKGQEFDYD